MDGTFGCILVSGPGPKVWAHNRVGRVGVERLDGLLVSRRIDARNILDLVKQGFVLRVALIHEIVVHDTTVSTGGKPKM